MYSSKASDHSAVESLVESGIGVGAAIEIVAREQFLEEMISIESLF